MIFCTIFDAQYKKEENMMRFINANFFQKLEQIQLYDTLFIYNNWSNFIFKVKFLFYYNSFINQSRIYYFYKITKKIWLIEFSNEFNLI